MKSVREYPLVKAWVSFSCQDGNAFKDQSKSSTMSTAYGESWAESVLSLISKYGGQQLMGIGINCTSPSSILPLLQSLKEHPKKRLLSPETSVIVYPNSGESWNPELGYFEGKDLKDFSHYSNEWIKLEIPNTNLWLGGCCQVFPNEISHLHDLTFKK